MKRRAASFALALIVAAGAIAALVAGAPAEPAAATDPVPVAISAQPIALDPSDPGRKAFGRLTWVCGVALSSPARAFGGFSGLAVDRSGKTLLAVTDDGQWLAASIVYRDGCATGLENARMAPLLGLNGKPLPSKGRRDAEALAMERLGATDGDAYVAFEGRHRVWRYKVAGGEIVGRPVNVALPSSVRALGSNAGIEGLAVIQDEGLKGAILMLAEAEPGNDADDGAAPGWLIHKGKTAERRIALSGGFKITDLAAMPDGSVLVLERRFKGIFDGVHMRIRRIKTKSALGRELHADTLLEIGGPGYAVDNMEAIAVHRDEAGEIVVTVLSDDNFSPLQRTLLMQFKFLNPNSF
jgi:hypothetical protein